MTIEQQPLYVTIKHKLIKLYRRFRFIYSSYRGVATDTHEVIAQFINPLVASHQKPILKNNRTATYGIRYPVLKSIAHEILTSNPYLFLESNDFSLYELEIMQTYVIGGLKNFERALTYFQRFLLRAKEWSLIDSLAQKFTITRRHPEAVFAMLNAYRNSNDEYLERMICVMGLSHFFNDTYLDSMVQLIDSLHHPGYYAKMGKAWAIAEYMVKAPNKALDYLGQKSLDPWTYRKALQKMLESNRIEPSLKSHIRELKSVAME